MRRRSRLVLLRSAFAPLALAAILASVPARADDLGEARDQFRRGAELARDAQWGAALAAFERSAHLHPHASTTYNVGVCQRALGQYVRARQTFARALSERTSANDLPESTVQDIQKFQAEIGRLIGTLDVSMTPSDARITVDGRPLESAGREGDVPVMLAGTSAAGAGERVPAPKFRVVLDPGHHVFVMSREGFSDAVYTDDVKPGESRPITLALDRLPATLHIAADHPLAIVTVDELDVGSAPVTVMRPAGKHTVVVRKPGFLPYRIETVTNAGQRADLVATLREDKPSVLTRWWFWTGAAVVLAGAAVTTYALTRPDPERPPADGGGLGWTVNAP